MRSPRLALLVTALVVILCAVGILSTAPPAPRPADAPQTEFSAVRAARHIEALATAPRPVASAAHAAARQYILDELAALGVEAETQTTTVVRTSPRGWRVASRVTNVVGRLPGREAGKALLLMAHYDSVHKGPGAGDDASGVAVMLETLRALEAGGEPLANDVLFLFSDAEELGLLGAQAFFDEHPRAADVGMVLNFEARGTEGPAFMFETGSGNGPLIEVFERAVERPMASSYGYEVYKVMPNDTDFSVPRGKGYTGLNFAFIHGATAYHSAQDSVARLDLASVQHLGDQALALARAFGEADLGASWQGTDAVYFNLGPAFFSYSGAWVLPLAALAALAWLVVVFLGFKRRRLSVGGLAAAGLMILLGALALAAVILFAGRPVFPGFYNFRIWGGLASNSISLLGLALVSAGLTVGLFRLLARGIRPANLAVAGAFLWLLLGALLSVVAPGASYLFILPLLLALLADAVWLGAEEGGPTAAVVALVAVAAGASALIWGPSLAAIGVALGGIARVLIAFMMVLALVGLSAPLLDLGRPRRRGWLQPVVWIVLGAVVLFAVRSATAYGPENRRPASLFYVLDADAGEAQWMSFDRARGPWLQQFLPADAESSPLPPYLRLGPRRTTAFAAPAAAAELAGGRIELVAAAEGEGVRTLELAVTWPYEVHRAILALAPAAALRSLVADGKAVEGAAEADGDGPFTLPFWAPPPEGLHLTVEVAAGEALEVTAVAQLLGLPELPGATYPPWPGHLMPSPIGWESNSTFVSTTAAIAPDQAPEAAGGEGPEGTATEEVTEEATGAEEGDAAG